MFGIGSMMPIRKTYWYSVDGDAETRHKLVMSVCPLRDVAVEAAEDYHGNHDGWESSWPLDFVIYETEEGPPVARFEVERETSPNFYASERELPKPVDAVDPVPTSSVEPSTREKPLQGSFNSDYGKALEQDIIPH